ncbi:MAG TPA: hypothetical protein VJC39_04085 [Candidatus Nanoarchaeia archaeon]|nr:hypothetical protein [Candidatus Nanoarchaeia archaeon]
MSLKNKILGAYLALNAACITPIRTAVIDQKADTTWVMETDEGKESEYNPYAKNRLISDIRRALWIFPQDKICDKVVVIEAEYSPLEIRSQDFSVHIICENTRKNEYNEPAPNYTSFEFLEGTIRWKEWPPLEHPGIEL